MKKSRNRSFPAALSLSSFHSHSVSLFFLDRPPCATRSRLGVASAVRGLTFVKSDVSVETEMRSLSQLSNAERRFILHWGEMGTKWGINRTVAQVYALLYLSPEPLNAEQIQAVLEVARSNVSTSLKELQGWGIVRLVHLPGDRRDHFESLKDVWEMFRIVLDERKRREFDPTMAVLRECIAEAEKDEATGGYSEDRLREMHNFLAITAGWYATFRGWPTSVLKRFFGMGDKARKLLGLTSE
jgi:DNA-binding transcriptional regulator GbsR (MarR family)